LRDPDISFSLSRRIYTILQRLQLYWNCLSSFPRFTKFVHQRRLLMLIPLSPLYLFAYKQIPPISVH